jgi:hypothetical protein
MTPSFHLRGRPRGPGSLVLYPGSYLTIEDALRAVGKKTTEPGEIVWIEDREGNLVLPADQVSTRLKSARTRVV